MKKSKIETNFKENRITLTFSKIVTKKDLNSIYTDIRFDAADLQPGYNVIADFSKTKIMYLNAISVFRNIFNFLISKNCGEIIRVLQDNRVLHKQLLNLVLLAPAHVPNYAPTVDAAKSKLKAMQRRNGIRFNMLQHPIEIIVNDQRVSGGIKNISTSGIAIVANQFEPEIDGIVEVNFELKNSKKEEVNFSIQSRIVRMEDDLFAVTYVDLDDATKKSLWNCIVVSGN